MDTMDYGGHDAFFIKMQEDFDARAAKTSKAAKGDGKKTYKPSKGFNSKFLRGIIFDDSAKRLRPDKVLLDQYKDYLTDEYAIALKKQLKISGRTQTNGVRQRWSNLGYATGNLRKSIKVNTKTIIEHSPKSGRYFIDFEMTPWYLDKEFGEDTYGNYIANGRSAGAIPDAVLVKWMENKIRLGSLKIYKKRKGTGDTNRKRDMLRIAKAISWAASKAPKPAVLKGWSSWDENPQLRRDFWEATKEKGSWYRGKIRKSIVKNLSIDYGKVK